MAIKINFDTANNPETPTLILATRDGNKLGQLEAKQIELCEKLIGASEMTFIVNKYVDGELTNLWDKIVDFKLVYCEEWDVWFEIRVEIDEDTKTVKTVFGTQLGQAELSQLMLYNIEINTEADIARDDYKISVLYDDNDHEASILHRLFEKAPHYSLPSSGIDSTVAKIQRSFSFDDISIYDALQEIAEEIGCLFVFHSGTDDDGNIERFITVHDLEQYCNDCGYRGEFTTVCSKCGSGNIRHGYGEDTTIFVTADALASNNIQFTTDTDSVKNCFKLEAGDDLMTATIRNCNPNGTDYIWYFSDSIKQDMSEALQKKLSDYDAKYKNYHDNYSANLNSTLLSKYNAIVNKYKGYNEDLENITSSIKGYSNLMNAYYNVIDLSLYLESGMMPTVKMSDTNATAQASLLTTSSLSPIAVANIEYVSVETVNSVALGMAKILVKPTYKVEINGTSSLSDMTDSETRTWRGSFVLTNYSDEEDTATTNTITLTVNGNAELFTKQKIEKSLNKADTEDYSIVGLFKRDLTSFEAELRKYALKPLSSFRDACQACIDILIEQGTTTKTDLYYSLYRPYWDKLKAIEAEMKVREDEIADIDGVYDEEGNLIKKGLASDIEKIKETIQDELDFEKYLGAELWFEFSSYRREDKYKNENYISDGLNNAELFTRALEFIDVAENEIYKSSELQHSISSSLKNLMAIKKFKPLVDNFAVGNWMRVQLDDFVYKLRLLEYTINFSSIEEIPVVFSDVSKVRNGVSDLEDLFSQASSMTTHYDSVKKQANKGQAAQGTIEQWLREGLNSALVRINNNDSEEVTITQNGILCRSYDGLTDAYSPEQLKLTHNILAYTNDDWLTVKQAIGKHEYKVYDEKVDGFVDRIGYGMSAEFLTTSQVMGSTIVGGEIYSANYHKGNSGSQTDNPMGTYMNLATGEFSFGGDKIVYDGNNLTLSDVTIQWSNTNKPDMTVENISGLKDYIDKLGAIEGQVDGKAETWYQSADPSAYWTTDDLKKEHIGDLWYYTGETGYVNGVQRGKGSEWIWQKVGGVYQWCEMDVPDEVYDAIDGKSSVYTTLPSNPQDGDLLIPSSNIGTQYLAGKVYKYNENTKIWSEIAYTDDTKADSALGAAEAAKKLGDELVNVLGYDGTKISGTYIYSPVISGGSLLMGSPTGIYAEITTDGVLNATGANISGNIAADSLIINNNATFGGIITNNNKTKLKSEWDLSSGIMSFSSGNTQVTISDGEIDTTTGYEVTPAGICVSLHNNSGSVTEEFNLTGGGISFFDYKYLSDYLAYIIAVMTGNPNAKEPKNPFFTLIQKQSVETKDIKCQNLYIRDYDENDVYVEIDLVNYVTGLESRVAALESASSTHTHNLYTYISKQPTCGETGIEVTQCMSSNCDYYTERVIEATGEHTDNNADGYCDVCGARSDNQTYYTVTTSTSDGGAILINGMPVTGSKPYAEGTYLSITAQANDGFEFNACSFNGSINNNPSSQLIWQGYIFNNIDVYADFNELGKYTITVVANPTEGGQVAGGGEYVAGEHAYLQAAPNDGYTFTGWSDGNTSQLNVITVNSSKTFTAYFEKDSSGGSSGSDTKLTTNIECSSDSATIEVVQNGTKLGDSSNGNYELDVGLPVTLTAKTNGYNYVEWLDVDNGYATLFDGNPYEYTVTSSSPTHIYVAIG